MAMHQTCVYALSTPGPILTEVPRVPEVPVVPRVPWLIPVVPVVPRVSEVPEVLLGSVFLGFVRFL